MLLKDDPNVKDVFYIHSGIASVLRVLVFAFHEDEKPSTSSILKIHGLCINFSSMLSLVFFSFSDKEVHWEDNTLKKKDPSKAVPWRKKID